MRTTMFCHGVPVTETTTVVNHKPCCCVEMEDDRGSALSLHFDSPIDLIRFGEQLVGDGLRLFNEPPAPTLAQVIADPAAFVTGMTETSETHSELPEHLKPKRNECWDMFDDGYVPTEPPAGSAEWEYGEVQEYTRWKLAGGQVRHVSEELPI